VFLRITCRVRRDDGWSAHRSGTAETPVATPNDAKPSNWPSCGATCRSAFWAGASLAKKIGIDDGGERVGAESFSKVAKIYRDAEPLYSTVTSAVRRYNRRAPSSMGARREPLIALSIASHRNDLHALRSCGPSLLVRRKWCQVGKRAVQEKQAKRLSRLLMLYRLVVVTGIRDRRHESRHQPNILTLRYAKIVQLIVDTSKAA
jgi:hypothetical protein